MGSGYDLTNKNPFRLMKGRLGAYEPQRFQSERTDLEGLHLNYEKFQWLLQHILFFFVQKHEKLFSYILLN